MTQAGLNTGPRHCRVIGWAKSYTKKLDPAAAEVHDQDVIGASSFFWSLAKGLLPSDTIVDVEKELENAELPRISTRHISQNQNPVLMTQEEAEQQCEFITL